MTEQEWTTFKAKIARPLPTIWAAARMRTEEERAASGDDEEIEWKEFSTKAEAIAACDARENK